MSKQNSFTLVELLVVMAIIGVLTSTLYTSFRGSTNSWTSGNARLQRCQNARGVLEIMSRELKQAFTKSGTNFEFYGINGTWTDSGTLRAADGIYFTSLSNYPNASDDYDICEVGYYILTTARILYRIEDDTIDSVLTDGTPPVQLGMHVIGMDLRYHNGTSWSSDGDYPESSTLPKAVEITLTVEDEDQIESPKNFKSIVYIP